MTVWINDVVNATCLIFPFSFFRFDLAKKHAELMFTFDSANIVGDYKVSGRILILPLTGAGIANLTLGKLKLYTTLCRSILSARQWTLQSNDVAMNYVVQALTNLI